MRVHADRDSCISSGQCVMTAPDVFDQDEDDGVVSLKTGTPPPELAQDVRPGGRDVPGDGDNPHGKAVRLYPGIKQR